MDAKLTTEPTDYGVNFFAGIAEGARRSADDVVKMVLQIFDPGSIIDFGGGGGHWAAACHAQGVSDILTIDGAWVPHAARVVSSSQFLEHDLALPLALNRTFDLAFCLEAAEHLPATAAPELVATLTDTAPVVIFSAALPGQGGDGHINEQLPSYWANLFAARGYACFTNLRRRIWDNEDIEVWYRQNLLCFVRQSEAHRWRPILGEPMAAADPLLNIVHPELLVRQKMRGDRLEGYARRLEGEVTQLHRDLKAATERLDTIVKSPVWRAWRMVSWPMRRLRAR